MFSDGFTVIDVRDPRQPRTVNFVAAPPNSRAFHLQTHGDLLLHRELAEHLGVAGLLRPERLFQRLDHRHLHPAREGVCRGLAGLRHLAPGRAARDRLHAGRGAGAASPVVCRRTLCLCLGALGRVHRPYPGDHRHEGADPAGGGRALVAAGHAREGRRDPELAEGAALCAAPCDRRRQSGLRRLARWRIDRARCLGPDGAKAAQPPQLVPALWRRHPYAIAAARAQPVDRRRRGQSRQLRQRHPALLGVRCARSREPGLDRHPADPGRGGLLRQGRRSSARTICTRTGRARCRLDH